MGTRVETESISLRRVSPSKNRNCNILKILQINSFVLRILRIRSGPKLLVLRILRFLIGGGVAPGNNNKWMIWPQQVKASETGEEREDKVRWLTFNAT